MTKVAAYLYKPAGKQYDFTEMVKYTELKAKDVDVVIDEFYADGWDDIPNGIDELLSDINNYNGILLYSLEGITKEHIQLLGKKSVYCITTPWIRGTKAPAQLAQVQTAGGYYKTMRSLNIRMGIKASSKQSGSAPYGFMFNEGILIQSPTEKPILENVLNWKKTGMAVSEISVKTGLDTWKIYSILNYWRDKK